MPATRRLSFPARADPEMSGVAAAAVPTAGDAASERPPVSPGVVLVLSVFALSWAGPLVRFTGAPALAISFWRLAIACGIVGVLLLVRGEWRELRLLHRRDWALAGLAGLFLAGHFVTWIASLQLTTVAASVVLVSTQPLWVALLSIPFLRERPRPVQWAGIGLAMAGAAWVGWGGGSGGAGNVQGNLLALSGAALAAAYYVLGRGLRRRVSIWPYVGVVYGGAALMLLLALIVSGTPVVGYATNDWVVFAALAIGPMMIGHTGQNWALRYLPAYAVNVSLLGEPVGATIIAWLLPGIRETPPAAVLLGGALILVGIAMGMRRR